MPKYLVAQLPRPHEPRAFIKTTRPATKRQKARGTRQGFSLAGKNEKKKEICEITPTSGVPFFSGVNAYCSFQTEVVGQDALELGLREDESIGHRYFI